MSLHDVEAEKAVLGNIMLLAGKTFPEVGAHIDDADFFIPAHAAIFRAMQELDKIHAPIDSVSVANRMESAGELFVLESQGGLDYLVNLTADVVTVEGVEYHARIVKNKSERRKWAIGAKKIYQIATQEISDEEWKEKAEHEILDLSLTKKSAEIVPMNAMLRMAAKSIEAEYDRRGNQELTGITTGFKLLDWFTNGFQTGDLDIVAARPSMGKTAFALNVIGNAAAANIPAMIFSQEMSTIAIGKRMISVEGGIDGNKMRDGAKFETEDFARLVAASNRMADRPVWFDDTCSLSISELRSRARRWRMQHKKHEKALIVVDYMQLMSSSGNEKNREREIADISRGLKMLARDSRSAVVALSQLNRSLESRPNKRPIMSDLRESGAIEQDADVIMFLYRDVVYNPDTENPNEAELIIAKARSGPTGTCKLHWNAEITKFSNLEQNR